MKGYCVDLDTRGYFVAKGLPLERQGSTKLKYIAPLLHHHADPYSRLTIVSGQKTRWSLVATSHLGYIPQTKDSPGSLHRDRFDLLDSTETAIDPNMDTILVGIDASGSKHHALPCHAVEDLLGGDPKRSELAVGELQQDLLLLLSDDIHFLNIFDLEQTRAGLLCNPLELS